MSRSVKSGSVESGSVGYGNVGCGRALTKCMIAGAVVALAAAGASGATLAKRASNAAAAKIASMQPSGETETCLPLRRITSIVAADERTLLVRAGRDYYVNRPSSRCMGADNRSTRFEYTTTIGSLCRNDIVRVVENNSGIFNGSCALGVFEKLAPAEKADEATES